MFGLARVPWLTLGDVASIHLGGRANPTGDGQFGGRIRDAFAPFSNGLFRTWHWGAAFHHQFADRLQGEAVVGLKDPFCANCVEKGRRKLFCRLHEVLAESDSRLTPLLSQNLPRPLLSEVLRAIHSSGQPASPAAPTFSTQSARSGQSRLPAPRDASHH